jgi:hypothetical protein
MRKDFTMLYFVQLWKNDRIVHPLCERVQAPSEGHAVVQVMRHHHLSYAARAWIGRSAKEPPTLWLSQLVVKGKVRAWKVEVEPIKSPHTHVS